MANKEERLNCWINLKEGTLLDLVVVESIDSRKQVLRTYVWSSVTISCALYNAIRY